MDLLTCPSCTHYFAGPWLQEFTDLRDKINTLKLEFSMIREVIAELDLRIPQTGRNYPIPKISERALARMEREAALAGQVSKITCGGKQRVQAVGRHIRSVCTQNQPGSQACSLALFE